MAVTTLYYSNNPGFSPNGTATNPYPLIVGGSLHSSITGFDYDGNTLIAYVKGDSTYTLTSTIDNSMFTTSPNRDGMLLFRAAIDQEVDEDPLPPPPEDRELLPWEPPNPTWISPMPQWDDSEMPDLRTTTDIQTVNQAFINFHGFKITATNRAGIVALCHGLSWCICENGRTNSSAALLNNCKQVTNCVLKMTGTSYNYTVNQGFGTYSNVRIDNNPAANNGNRRGFSMASAAPNSIANVTVIGTVGDAFIVNTTSTSAALNTTIANCTVYDCARGFRALNTGTDQVQAVFKSVFCGRKDNHCFSRSASQAIISESNAIYNYDPAYDSSMGDYGNLGLDVEIDDDIDTDDLFVNPAAGDLRIKASHHLHGTGIGAGDEPVSENGGGGGEGGTSLNMRGGFLN